MFWTEQYHLYQTPCKFRISSTYTWKDLLKIQNLISSFPSKTLKTSKIIIKIIQDFKYVWPLFIYILFISCKWSEVTRAFDMLSQKTLCLPIGTISPIYLWLCHAHRFHCVNFLQLLLNWHFLRENDLFKHLPKNRKDITFSLKFVSFWLYSFTQSKVSMMTV